MIFTEIIMNTDKCKQYKIIEKILWGAIILSPIILLAIQSAVYGRNLFLGVPEWSDELDYWREMYSFSGSGFSFGGSMFFGYDAKVGPLGAHSFSPLFAWGPFFWLFRTSYSIYAIVWINLFYMTAAWGLFVALVKPNITKSVIAAVLAYSFPLTVLYLNTSMIEMVCMAGIIAYFSLMYKWDGSEKSNKWFILTLLVGIWCMLLRPTYVVILFPSIWMKNKFKINKYTIISMLAYVVAFGAFYKVYGLFCSDYPGWVTSRLAAQVGIRNKLSFLLANAKLNLRNFFSYNSADWCQVGLRYFYFVVTGYMLVRSFIGGKRINENADVNTDKNTNKSADNSIAESQTNFSFKIDRLYLSLFIMMFGLWAMMIVLYDILEWRDFRTFAPIVFGAVLFTSIKENRKRYLSSLAAMYTLLVILFGLSGMNFIISRGYHVYQDLSPYFSMLETTDESGNARTLTTDFALNWCDISVVRSLPPQMGFQVYNGVVTEEEYQKAEYVFIPEYIEIESGEFVINIPGYGNIYKMY